MRKLILAAALCALALPALAGDGLSPLTQFTLGSTSITLGKTTSTVTGLTLAFGSNTLTGVAPLASPTFTGVATSPQLTIAGNITANSWTTCGLGIGGTAGGCTATYTDANGTGTIAHEAAFSFPLATIAATNAGVTVTNLSELYLPTPAAGTNVTPTNLWSLYANGNVNVGNITMRNGGSVVGAFNINQNANNNTNINTGSSTGTATIGNNAATVSIVGAVSINASNNTTTNIGTGTTTSTVAIGGGSNTVNIGASTGSPINLTASAGNLALVNVTTGTNADVVCLASGNKVTLQAAASCTISSKRFKENIHTFMDSALAEVMKFKVITFNYKHKWADTNPDPNARTNKIGILAEDVARIEPHCAVYERDMKTPKSWDEMCMIAVLTKAIQQQQHEIDALKGAKR